MSLQNIATELAAEGAKSELPLMPEGQRLGVQVYVTMLVEDGIDAVVMLEGGKRYPDFTDAVTNAKRVEVAIRMIAETSGTKPEEWRVMTHDEASAYIRAEREGEPDDEDEGDD